MTSRKIAAIIVSTRPNRKGPVVGAWVNSALADRSDLDVSLVDLAEFGLPVLDEPKPAQYGEYAHDHTKAWSAVVDAADGFIIITPEYNRAMPASLKNAFDFLYREWAHKPVAFVGYSAGPSGGMRSIETAKPVASTLSMLPLSTAVMLPRVNSLIEDGRLRPPDGAEETLQAMADSLVAHVDASRHLRSA